MAVAGCEVRFPVWDIQRGLGTIPVFASRLSGATFLEMGSAGRGRLEAPRWGMGIEARLGLNLLFVGSEVRLGWAMSPDSRRPGNEIYTQLGIAF
jgi:hypothetical protein